MIRQTNVYNTPKRCNSSLTICIMTFALRLLTFDYNPLIQ